MYGISQLFPPGQNRIIRQHTAISGTTSLSIHKLTPDKTINSVFRESLYAINTELD